jgi:hypothetical protein
MKGDASPVTYRRASRSYSKMKSPFHNPVRLVWLGVLLTLGAVLTFDSISGRQGPVSAATDANPKPPVPVLVELFTSEGCSSCPPADALLALLDEKQPIAAAHAIVLSEHVTYWNQDGWHDPFSSDAVTDRQKQYGDRFGLSDVYTPQVVVDGAAQLVGSNARGLQEAIEHAASSGKAELSIQDAQWSGGAVHFSVRGADPKAVLTAALAEDSAQSSVKRGENAGRNLRHVAVVRVMEEMGKGAADGRALILKAPAETQTVPMRLVVFVTDHHNGHVLAVAEKTIAPQAS